MSLLPLAIFFFELDNPVSLRSASTSSRSELRILLIILLLVIELMLGERRSIQTLGCLILGFPMTLEFGVGAAFKVQKLNEPGSS